MGQFQGLPMGSQVVPWEAKLSHGEAKPTHGEVILPWQKGHQPMVTRPSAWGKFIFHGKESFFHGKVGSIMEFLIMGTHGPHVFLDWVIIFFWCKSLIKLYLTSKCSNRLVSQLCSTCIQAFKNRNTIFGYFHKM